MKVLKLLLFSALTSTMLQAQTLKSKATLRLEEHDRTNSCKVTIPNNPEWNISYNRYNLQGDLAPNVRYTRRDPSSVIKVNGKYYVWYSYSLTNAPGKQAPWDFNDLYYATSTDGYDWKEEGPAVQRGPAGSADFRSAFTTEIFYHEKKFYLIYQAASNLEGIYGKNTIAMAWSDSPDGPWTKLDKSILAPTVSNQPVFDSNAVHDPCVIPFKGKFYLYYKGEGNERNVCGLGVWNLDKQVKWGVAIADNPTGPYVKSPYNPVTNTGHEVCVWKSGEGIGIMLHQDGPEFGTLQYASDGINFDIKGEVESYVRLDPSSDYPEAAGLYRPVGDEISPVTGVSWGLCHVLTREQGAFWMYLKRFESEDKQFIVDDADNNGIIIENLSTENIDTDSNFNILIDPKTQLLSLEVPENGIFELQIITFDGKTTKAKVDFNPTKDTYDTSILSEGYYILKLKNSTSNKVYQKKFVKA